MPRSKPKAEHPVEEEPRQTTRFLLGFDADDHPDHGVLPTGFDTIDQHLMIDFKGDPLGGLPRGGLYEVSGTKESGKSRLCYLIMAEEQRAGRRVALCDVENRMVLSGGLTYVKGCGVETTPELFLYFEPNDEGLFILEEVFDAICGAAIQKLASLVVIDSLAALQPRSIEAYVHDAKKRKGSAFQSDASGQVARAQLAAMRRTVPICVKHGLTVIIVNHRRQSPDPFGPPDYAPGGTAKDHLLNAALCLNRVRREVDTGDIEVQVRVEKSNVSRASGVRTGLKTEGSIPNIVLPAPRLP